MFSRRVRLQTSPVSHGVTSLALWWRRVVVVLVPVEALPWVSGSSGSRVADTPGHSSWHTSSLNGLSWPGESAAGLLARHAHFQYWHTRSARRPYWCARPSPYRPAAAWPTGQSLRLVAEDDSTSFWSRHRRLTLDTAPQD